MSSTANITYVTRKEIDVERWDYCIKDADNGLIYAYSYYLDAMCSNWDALVLGDYETVVPLPWRKKFGIRYVYTPAFVQQLGIIGELDSSGYGNIIQELQRRFPYGDIFLNYKNHFDEALPLIAKTNYVLSLEKSYEDLTKDFSKDLIKNLKVASRYNFQIQSQFDPEHVIDLFKQNYSNRIPSIKQQDYQNFLSLVNQLHEKGMAFTKLLKSSTGETEAAALCLRDKGRLYNIMNVSTASARKKSANHYLLTEIIREFAEKETLFDFEGSDVPGIREFYLNFHPTDQPYYHYHFNNLPFPLNIIKK